MQDVRLWEQLWTPGQKPAPDLLRQLSLLPMEERFPFLDLVRPLLDREESEIRQAAVAVMAGADGRGAMQWLLAAMGDPDAGVRSQAVQSFLASLNRDPERWVHAAFHPSKEIRDLAAAAANTDATRAFNLFAPSSAVNGLPEKVAPDLLPLVLRLHAQSRLPLEATRRLATPTALMQAPAETIPLAVELYQNGPGSFWRELTRCLLARHSSGRRSAWVEAVVQRASVVPAEAMEMAVLFEPRILLQNDLDLEVRRRALAAVYRYSAEAPALSAAELSQLLSSELCWEGKAWPRLWEWGAVLILARKLNGGPYELLRRHFSMDTLRAVLREDPNQAIWLFSVSASRSQRLALARQLFESPELEVNLAAALLWREPEESGWALERLTSRQRLEVLQRLYDLEAGPGAGKLTRAAQILSPLLAERPEAYLPLASCDTALARDCLREVADQLGAEAFAQACLRQPAEVLDRLLTAIDHTPAFPHGVLLALAGKLLRRPQGYARRWAEGWLPPPPHLEASLRRSARPLTESERETVSNCPAEQLQSALGECLTNPSLGLTAALAARRDPEPNLWVCLALVACHDPSPSLDEQFLRFAGPDRLFSETLAAGVVGHWEGHQHLPLWGNCWLYRWEHHLDAVEKNVGENPENLLAFARGLESWKSPLVRGQGWACLAALLSRWRYRQPERLLSLATPELAAFLGQALPEPNGPRAATCLLRLHQAGYELTSVRSSVVDMLAELTPATREMLWGWVQSRGISGVARRRPRPQKGPILPANLDLEELTAAAGGGDPNEAQEACLRLVEGGQEDRLAGLIHQGVPQAALLTESVTLWRTGPALDSLRPLLRNGPAEVRFVLGLCLLERGEAWRLHWEPMTGAVNVDSQEWWFQRVHWERWQRLGPSALELARALAVSPQPHAYIPAVELLLGQAKPETECLQDFLRQGSARREDLRLACARRLAEAGNLIGWPLLVKALTTLPAGAGPQAVSTVRSLLWAGQALPLARLLQLFALLEDEDRPAISAELLRDSDSTQLCTEVLSRLRRGPRRAALVAQIAEAFAWGIVQGRQLSGRLFSIEMCGGDSLGFTYLQSDRIFVNPLPLLRGEQHGPDIVRGLMIHEIGHHLYHRQEGPWDEAGREGLKQLFNLVADEHLERRLRERDRDYGDKLKRLAAYAFQHSRREFPVWSLLTALAERAPEILTQTRLEVARRAGCVKVASRDVVGAMQRHGSAFAHFVRSLRMGLGVRDANADPRVQQALDLFGKNFKDCSLQQLLTLTRQLAQIFGDEISLIKCFHPEGEEWAEILARGEGLSNEELQREVSRLLGRTSAVAINLDPQEEFPALSTLVRVPYDALKHAEYARQVARPARRMREYLERLGLRYRPQPRRLAGHRLDRARLPRTLAYGDPHILVSRRLEPSCDLFLGLLVDCSGSMAAGDQIHKARLFATLLTEAARGLAGIDVHVLGFTHAVLYDAGDAQRCSAHNLEAKGGNNDAGALAYAANLALRSRRRARLLVMISDGLPTECSVAALKGLVSQLSRRRAIACAQLAVRPLEHVCFPHYLELSEGNIDRSVTEFGRIVTGLIGKSLRGAS